MGPTIAVSFLMLPSATFNDVTLLVSFARCDENPYLILILLVKAAHPQSCFHRLADESLE